MELILSTAYAGPVEYYHLLATADKVSTEACEHFVKQTYRNRCVIYGANGALNLSIPIADRKDKALTKDIRISYAEDWQRKHWRSIESAYRTSAFYEYYCDELAPFYQKKYTFLLDLNTDLQQCILQLTGIELKADRTENFLEKYPAAVSDHRNDIEPGKTLQATFAPYYQVFANKHGFKPGLSIYDLLFNVGNRSREYLLNSVTFG